MISPVPVLAEKIAAGFLDSSLASLYGTTALAAQKKRYARLLEGFARSLPDTPVLFVTSPGRTELGGNHTDHNHGCVLAAAVDLDCVAAVTPVDQPGVTLFSENYPEPIRVDLTSLQPQSHERGTPQALVRGVAAAFFKATGIAHGFHGHIHATCLVGSGLSSSAAFSLMVGAAFNFLHGGNRLSPRVLALMAQEAENEFFGKPCGLMDQMASAEGWTVFIDFNEPARPLVRRIDYSFTHSGYTLALIDTGAGHDALTPEYASISLEMRAAAEVFGQSVGRGITVKMALDRLPEIREAAGDRAALRLLHFIEENDRVQQMAQMLVAGDFSRYLQLVQMSGASSQSMLQNCATMTSTREQGILLALALSQRICSRAVCRVHGGGFAGTVQAYVPKEEFDGYRQRMETVFGGGSVMEIRLGRPGVCAVGANGLVLPKES